ncbi:MAG: aa3-type cytochrome c oxidase subunit IV [Robiginitomaculum sp.]|nr:aa3-type cytochrome c oxidase subunit IV [Robiginitomaculum sp.]
MSDYVHGNMSIVGQDKTFKGFVRLSAFFTAFFIVVLLMPILVFGAKLGWPLALVISFIVGVVIAPAFKLGGGWYATLFGLAILAGVIGIFFSAIT